MKLNTLGNTDTQVSELCLGSMTWGTQNTAAEAFSQIDYAIEHGINIIDTAELYPTTPLSAETQGDTESIIGQWISNSGKRDKVLLATKVAGNGPKWIDDGKPITGEKIRKSLEGSLQRLQCDTIDLYQLHWPNRKTYHFRQSWHFDPTTQNKQETLDSMHEVLRTLAALIRDGKIRHIGLSNESCWGTAQYVRLAEEHNLPRMVSIQNEYSLLDRLFDLDLAELAHNEGIGLLAFSPLAAGMLSGKYEKGAIPKGSRRSMQADLTGRYNERSVKALRGYLSIAKEHQLDPAQMALAFCTSRPFMTSTIIGATTMEQLATNVGAADITLTDEVMNAIGDVYRALPQTM
ncbi:MAG: aldo/keto reductase [Granulosicoccaceae bacterium]